MRISDWSSDVCSSDLIQRLKVRSATGALVPLGTLVEIKNVSGPNLVQRYNMYVSVPVQGNASPGTSTGDALDAMDQVNGPVLPPATEFEWSSRGYQERNTGNKDERRCGYEEGR